MLPFAITGSGLSESPFRPSKQPYVTVGYEPNEAARMLKGQSSRTIGLIIPDFADTFLSICANVVQQKAAKRGYLTLLLCSDRDRDNELGVLSMMMSRNIAGMLVVPSSENSVAKLCELRERGVPVGLLDRTFLGVNVGSGDG